VQVSSLGVAPFIEELSSVIDFSDHSKMPEKFGFKKADAITFKIGEINSIKKILD